MTLPSRQVIVLVDCDPMETRIAVLDNGRLVDLEVDREARIVENIYKGVVRQIVPGIGAAFVDIGLERNGFLYVDDIVPGGLGVSGQTNATDFATSVRRSKRAIKCWCKSPAMAVRARACG